MEQPEEKVVTLRHPVMLGKGPDALVYTELRLRSPKVGELEKATREDTPIGQSITLIALIAGIPRRAAEDIFQDDWEEANEYLQGFTGRGRVNGQTP